MKLHVQCDRCKKYAEVDRDAGPYQYARAPAEWTHLRTYQEPVRIEANYGLPDGAVTALLCGDCMPVVQRAIEAAIARKT